jgi:hypothetical protein
MGTFVSRYGAIPIVYGVVAAPSILMMKGTATHQGTTQGGHACTSLFEAYGVS